jgi:hypothetical protein
MHNYQLSIIWREVVMPEISVLDAHTWTNLGDVLLRELVSNTTFLAQNFRQYDVLGDMQKAFDNFIQSGQVWALLIGVFFGYLIKSLTSY